MNPYHEFVSTIARTLRNGRELPLGGFKVAPPAKPNPGAPVALIFSPHPDDEVIIGGLALRLLRELGMNVINVAVTQGSNNARQEERWKELSQCCEAIGFGLVQLRKHGLEAINPKMRSEQPVHWSAAVEQIVNVLNRYRPKIIFFPHDQDWNITHIGTHHLVVDALANIPGFACYAVETEFWGAMDTPNLMVESSEEDVAALISALSFHVGEVRRNPYHSRLPAWMIDNVRRGGELVGGQGAAAPDFVFATLYRLRKWQGDKFESVLSKGRLVGAHEPLDLFPV